MNLFERKSDHDKEKGREKGRMRFPASLSSLWFYCSGFIWVTRKKKNIAIAKILFIFLKYI